MGPVGIRGCTSTSVWLLAAIPSGSFWADIDVTFAIADPENASGPAQILSHTHNYCPRRRDGVGGILLEPIQTIPHPLFPLTAGARGWERYP